MTSIPVMRSRDDLCAHVAQGGQPKYLPFWGHTPAKDGAMSKACFSQWYASVFEVDGVRYRTAEHFMMAGKARLFADQATLGRQILGHRAGGRRCRHGQSGRMARPEPAGICADGSARRVAGAVR